MSLKDLINPPKNSQQQLHQWQVVGCSTRPMGNYLKALGLLRIMQDKIAPEASGFWYGDRFWLQSSIKPDEIISQILTDYQPSAICTPWNGSSGFYQKMPRFMSDIIESECPRWKRLKNAYKISQRLTEPEGTRKALKNKNQKFELIARVRSAAIEPSWNDWLNIVSVPQITIDKNGRAKQEYVYPGITGSTGGIIGNKDMGVCFAEALSCLWEFKTGQAKPVARSLIESSLLGKATKQSLIKKSLLTQFYPVNDFLLDISGAANHREYAKAGSTTVLANPFDAILIYEGLLTFSGVSSRIKNTNSQKTQATFSLAVDLAVGTADVAALTEDKQRTEEIWLPLWKLPKTWNEVRDDIFNPNRRRLPQQQITDTLDFAYSLARWSKNNAIDRYIRYAFLSRKGKSSNLAIPVGEFSSKTTKAGDLAAQLRYFRRDCRRISRDDYASNALKSAIALLEKELIQLAAGKGFYLNCLIQIGVLEQEISYSGFLDRPRSYFNALQPLKTEWLDRALAEDNSSECRLGIALASLGLRSRATKIRANTEGKLVWVKDAQSDWGKRSLIDNLVAMQRRWLVDRNQNINPIPSKLVSPSFADLDNFIQGNVSDVRIAQIALGASTCVSVSREFKGGYLETLPPHYGIGALCQWGRTDNGEAIGERGLVLNALDQEQPAMAMEYGLQRLRSRGLFPYLKHPDYSPNAKRIAAAMAFPLSKDQLINLQNYYLKSVNPL